jgi:hypothetical protein
VEKKSVQTIHHLVRPELRIFRIIVRSGCGTAFKEFISYAP